MNKETLRKKYKIKRDNLNIEDVTNGSNKIIKKILEIVDDNSSIGIYYPINNEIELLKITELRQVYLPKYNKVRMEFVESSVNNFRHNLTEKDKIIQKSNIDYIVCPGIVFDKSFNRIGFGKGYYDKYLEDYKGIKIGVCLDEFIVDTIDSEIHDIKMDYIITNKRIIKIDTLN